MQLCAQEMSPPVHVTEGREAIKALANSWSSGSRHTVGVEREMEEEGGGKGGPQGKSGKASME